MQKYNKKMTVCFLLILPVTWFHFSRVRLLISWGDILQWYTSVYTADLQKLTFFMLLRDCRKLTNWKITEILFVLLRVVLAILCCIGKTNPRGKKLCQNISHPGMNTEPKSLSSSVICESGQNNHWCVHYMSDLVAKV